PARAVLIGQQNWLTPWADARVQARRLDFQQRHEAVNLGLLGNQLGQNPAEPERVFAQRRPHPLLAGGRRVALVAVELDDVERRVEIALGALFPGAQLVTDLYVLALEQLAAAKQVDGPMLRGGHQPGAGIVRDA